MAIIYRNAILAMITITALITGITSSDAQAKEFTVKTIQRLNWKFPVVSGSSKTASDRINFILFTNAFDRDLFGIPPAAPEDSLKIIDEENSRVLANLDFHIIRNDSRIFSVEFNGEGCGASCSSFSNSLNFDASTGRLLTDFDLFTKSGRLALLNEIRKQNQTIIKKHILTIGRVKPTKDTPQEEITFAVEAFQECLKNWQSNDWYTWAGDMQLNTSVIKFTNGQCLDGYARAMDDLGDLRNSFSYVKLKPWLSDYGRMVLLGEMTSDKPTWPFGQLLRGTVGSKNPISMYIEKSHDAYTKSDFEILGFYFYDRYRKPINIKGRWENGKISLDEFDKGDEAKAFFSLVSSKNGIIGEWKSRDGKKVFNVRLEP